VTAIQEYQGQGVSIIPEIPKPERPMKLIYNGLLAQNGATEVMAHVGFNEWKDVRDYRMVKTRKGFEISITPPYNAKSVSICFKDVINNWDNNSGVDYNYDWDLSSIVHTVVD